MIYTLCNLEKDVLFKGTPEEINEKYGFSKIEISNAIKQGKLIRKNYVIRDGNYSYMTEVISVYRHLERYGNTIIYTKPNEMIQELKKLGMDAKYKEDILEFHNDSPMAKKTKKKAYIVERV